MQNETYEKGAEKEEEENEKQAAKMRIATLSVPLAFKMNTIRGVSDAHWLDSRWLRLCASEYVCMYFFKKSLSK